MRDWSVSYNNYYRTGSIHLREGSWYLFFLQDFVWGLCDKIPAIPLPPVNIKIPKDEVKYNDGKEYARLDEYYYDLHHWFHDTICLKVFNWCEGRITEYDIKPSDIKDLEEVIQKTNPKWWAEMQEELEREKNEQKEE